MDRLKKYTSGWLPADYILAALLISFPVYNRLMPVLMILLGITLQVHRKSWRDILDALKPGQPHVWLLLFFLAHIIGLAYTENFDFAYNDIGMKISLFALPLLLLWGKSKITLLQIVDLFLVGLLLACTVAYSYAIFRSIYNTEDNQWWYFTESYLSFFMHRSYFATYLAIGVLLSVYRYFNTKKWLYILCTIILGMTTILTFSKAGILIMVVTVIPLIIAMSIRYYSWLVGVVISFAVIGMIIFSLFASPTLRRRFGKMMEGMQNVSATHNITVESSASRVIMWSTSMKLIKENPVLGVGTGDVSDALDQKNIELGNTGVAEQSLNAHNQYLNTWVQLGLIGLIPLLMIFITAFRNAFRHSSIPLIIVASVLFLTLLFESFLETQAGIIPVTFLICLFSIKSSEPKGMIKFKAIDV